EQEIGGPTLQPRLLPRGYGALETATVVDGEGVRWLKRTYSDGVEPSFFFQARAGEQNANRPRGVTPSRAGIDRADATASSVTVFEVGTATAIQGTVDGFQVMVIGRVPREELLDLIESSL